MNPERRLVAILLVASIGQLATVSGAWGNAGVFMGNGQNLRQVTSKTIQLVAVDVTIVLGRGPFLFDGSLPGMDRAAYECTFVLRNLSDKAADVQVGFPVDSQFARGPTEARDARQWVLDYGFISRDERATYHVDFVRRQPKGPDDYGAIFVWKMRFAPKEKKTLSVQYRIPMSMGLASTRKDGAAPVPQPAIQAQLLLESARLEFVGYVTATGSSWAGNVATATFTVITAPFEEHLTRRGFFEASAELTVEENAQMKAQFPLQRPWWFRQITPAGYQPVKGGVQWRHRDFKPRDSISVRYYVTQIPQVPADVDAFVDRLPRSDLVLVREILLATYGKEPESDAAKAFAAAQVWYAPRQDFSMAGLTPTQRAVLEAFDRRMGASESGEGSLSREPVQADAL